MSLGKRDVNSERLPRECGLPTQKLRRKQVASKVQEAHVSPTPTTGAFVRLLSQESPSRPTGLLGPR